MDIMTLKFIVARVEFCEDFVVVKLLRWAGLQIILQNLPRRQSLWACSLLSDIYIYIYIYIHEWIRLCDPKNLVVLVHGLIA